MSKTFRITVEVDGQVTEQDLLDQTAIDTTYEGLNQGLAEHPGRFAWWAILESIAKKRVAELKVRLEKQDAELFAHYQQAQTATVEKAKGIYVVKPPTLDAIRSAVVQDQQHIEAQQALQQAEFEADQLGVARAAMYQKKEALLAIASNMRAEMDHRMFVARREAETGPIFRGKRGGS